MKIKNINIAERHVEKVILGLCVIATLYFLYAYAIGGSYEVTVNNRQMTPNELEDQIRGAANNLKTSIQSAPVPEVLLNLEVAPYARNFIERYERPILADVFNFDIGPGMPPLASSLIGAGTTPQNRNFAMTRPPTPTNVQARADFGMLVLGPNEPHREAFLQLVGENRPYDFWYVSVQAQFDMSVWRQLQLAEPPEMRVPADWTRDSSFVVDVMLERQAWDPFQGAWGEVETISPVPGNLNFRGRIPAQKAVADQWIEEIRLRQDVLTKPPFAPVAPLRPWLPPDVIGQLTPQQVLRLREIEAEKAQIREQLDGVAPPPSQPSRPGFGAGDFGGDESELSPAARRSGGLIGRAPVTGGPPTATVSSADLVRRFQALNAEYLQLIGAQDQGVEAFDPVNAQAMDVVKVWQHDMTAEPGMTYRYRIVVGVINPLFQRAQLGVEQRRAEMNVLVRPSQPSAWTEPVSIPQDRQFFVASQDLGNARAATIEVWSIFEGAWRRSTFTVQPGDPIGGVVTVAGPTESASVDLSVNATVVDVDPEFAVSSQPNARTTRVLYMDDTTGELYWQTAYDDANSTARRALQAN